MTRVGLGIAIALAWSIPDPRPAWSDGPSRRGGITSAVPRPSGSDVGPADRAGQASGSSTGPSASFPDTLAWYLDSRVRGLHAGRLRMARELDGLPPLSTGHRSERLGYHSPYLNAPDEHLRIRIDLGEPVAIDAVALIPARAVVGSSSIEGYGFPRRFRIDLADTPGFEKSLTVADHTDADLPNPGPFPYLIPVAHRTARYVRITSTRHWERGRGLWIVAMGEVVVLSGERNAAAGRPVDASRSSRSSPSWAEENLVDGQSNLGLPIAAESSPTNGYHAAFGSQPDAPKWVQVDLGTPRPIDEVRLIPAHPADFADTPGYGFPVRFRVEASQGPEFRPAALLADYTDRDVPNPGNNPFYVPGGGLEARFVRVTVTRDQVFSEPHRHVFALAELQVISDGRNVALGAEVSAADRFSFEPRPLWEPRYLTDGYGSQNRLAGLSGWLRGLARRGELERRLGHLERERREAVDAALTSTAWIGGTTIVGVILAVALEVARRRRIRRRQLARLREQIAGDLHDEIGSNLGSISLISQMALEGEIRPAAAREDFAEIFRVTRQTDEAMRGIVWLLNSGDTTCGDLARHMRQVARTMLPGCEVVFRDQIAQADAKLPLPVRRHLLLAYKETLNNVARHAGADRVEIDIGGTPRHFRFVVRDHGVGFDPGRCEAGHGTTSLRRRAAALGGEVRVRSRPGEGTTVEFEARIS